MWPSDPCPSPWDPFREAKACPGERQVLGAEAGVGNVYLYL